MSAQVILYLLLATTDPFPFHANSLTIRYEESIYIFLGSLKIEFSVKVFATDSEL